MFKYKINKIYLTAGRKRQAGLKEKTWHYKAKAGI
jgi:hypothetical protein